MTRLVLDKVHVVGPVRMAVIAEVDVEMHSVLRMVGGQGVKTPRYVLIEDEKGLKAFAPHGTPVPLSDIEACCPNLLAAFHEDAIGDAL